MNKSYDELCQEVALLHENLTDAARAIDKARTQGTRLENQLQASNAMLREALELGEEFNARCRVLEAENARLRGAGS
ncbi:hypothetical protein [Salinicola sp. CR57]|uniref:hypothetical protein n=1 Tax=Salinicola sp. CR57 TaxID=1949086 RepID=UPI000DA16919|nr:hypothetical protein [Salinicola sp. CR57]